MLSPHEKYMLAGMRGIEREFINIVSIDAVSCDSSYDAVFYKN